MMTQNHMTEGAVMLGQIQDILMMARSRNAETHFSRAKLYIAIEQREKAISEYHSLLKLGTKESLALAQSLATIIFS